MFVPKKSLLLLYNAYFHSHLMYGITVWYGHLKQSLSDQLYRLQKRLIRIVHNKKFLEHCDPLFVKSNILKLQDQAKLEFLKIIQQVEHGKMPICVKNLFEKSQSSRTKSYIIKKHSKTITGRSFLCQSVRHWNQLSTNLQYLKSKYI